MRARILSHHGRQAWAIDQTGHHHQCVFKGRDLLPVANDDVELDTSENPPVITQILPRANQLIRSEAHRSKGLAANLDQAMIVISGAPLFSDEILARMICACAAEAIPGLVVLNKIDLIAATTQAQAQLRNFDAALTLLGWKVLSVSALTGQAQGMTELRQALAGKATVVMGQSGMGKSSLMNALIPGINLQTREISEALQTGKHTTTAGLMVRMETPMDAVSTTQATSLQESQETWLIDTPGFQLYGLNHLSESELALGFPEWRLGQEQHGRCRYFNCKHLQEPGCTIRAMVDRQEVSERRLALWKTLLQSI
jgi:ribosome biogenesis GTPase / thiamine phosphate phosphatase